MSSPARSISAPSNVRIIGRIENPSEEFFRQNYVEKGLPVVIANAKPRSAQWDWNFSNLGRLAGDCLIPVYDWGGEGPTVQDNFLIKQMKLREAIKQATSVTKTSEQRFAVCQLPIEALPPLAEAYQVPPFLKNATKIDRLPMPFRESPRCALFISFFRGIHFHNGREAVAQLLTGSKKFTLYHPKDSRYLYPRKLIGSGLSWFDETEAVFCSEIPFEQGVEAIDRKKFPLFERATPFEVELKAGESLYIPSHWWHFTHAHEPSAVIVEFWDAPLRRWGYPIAWRSLIMKPYRKYLYWQLLKLKTFSRNQQVLGR
jgi:Cupin-like domain